MKINLLPWREQEQRRRRRMLFRGMAVSAALILCPAAAALWWGLAEVRMLERDAAEQQDAVIRVQDELARLDSSRLRQQTDARQHAQHVVWHRMRLDQLGVLLQLGSPGPAAFNFERVRISEHTLILDGQSLTASRLDLLTTELGALRSLQRPDLRSLALDESGDVYRFRLEIPWQAVPPQLPGGSAL